MDKELKILNLMLILQAKAYFRIELLERKYIILINIYLKILINYIENAIKFKNI